MMAWPGNDWFWRSTQKPTQQPTLTILIQVYFGLQPLNEILTFLSHYWPRKGLTGR